LLIVLNSFDYNDQYSRVARYSRVFKDTGRQRFGMTFLTSHYRAQLSYPLGKLCKALKRCYL